MQISPDTQMFNEEMEKYKNEDLVPLSQVPSEGVLNFGSENHYYGSLARSVLGHLSSSAAIERDFGISRKFFMWAAQ